MTINSIGISNSCEVHQHPAVAAEIEAVSKQLAEIFDAVLLDDYCHFLNKTNGLDYNDFVLYGARQSPDNPGAGSFWQGVGCHQYFVTARRRRWRFGAQ